ncbi:MAG: nucleotidyl transferase AbiEii/AbiGii toxin family protein [Candidatus Eremiobacterota bacterium]
MLGERLDDLLVRANRALEATGVRYALIGGLAINLSGRGRSTRDVDFVVQLPSEGARHLIDAARAQGFAHHDRADVHPLDGVTLYRFWLPVEGRDLSLAMDVQAGHTEFHAGVLDRARELDMGSFRLRVASVEDLVLLKLLAFRPIDRADAIDLMTLEGPALDTAYLETWASRLGVEERWQEVVGMTRKPPDS